MSKKKILLVEDEPHLAFNLELNLSAEGYDVRVEGTGEGALNAYDRLKPFDLIILDVMIPEPNGYKVAKYIRSHDPKTAIIMLTARAGNDDRIRGLEIGVDDYICKPFHLKEFLLKVNRATRRNEFFKSEEGEGKNVLACGPFKLDNEGLTLNGPIGKFDLTALEADILNEFIANQNRVLSREYLLEKVWGRHGTQETRTVDNFIMRLRKYIESDPSKPKVLQSIRGRGYRFNPSVDSL